MLKTLVRLLVLCAPLYALAASAPLGMQSPPDAIARALLGGRPGAIAVGLWRDDKAAYAELRRPAAGAAVASEPEGDSQLFEIGSITKVFTGLLLAQAVERGDFALDDTLGKLLPPLLPAPQALKLSPEVAAITLRQLVTHTSCLPRMPANFPDLNAANPYPGYSRAMMLAELSALKPQRAPCAVEYSNFGFAVLGELLSLRYGQPWETLAVERIIKPLGMSNTFQHLPKRIAERVRVAPPFSGDAPASPWDFDAFAGAGSLRSTAPDMLAFGRALMAGRGGPLGAAAERALQPLAPMNGGQIGYALMMRGPAERRTYFHSGGTGGYRSQLLLMPDVGQAAIVMVSNAEANADAFGADVLAARYTINDTSIALDAAALPEYAGVFRADAKIAFTFVVQDGKLYGRLTGQGFTALTPAAPDVFTLPQYGAEFTFGRENGKVATMTLRQHGGQIPARRTAEPAPALAFDQAITAERYAGHYLSNGEGAPKLDFDVRAEGGQLSARLDQQPLLPVFPVPGKADRFAWDVVAAELQFERNAAGAVTALALHQDGRTIRATRAANAPAAANTGAPAK
ncbi:CubicO group peptidase (beta-lactamase class C family) [Duganella sp. 1411]|uniref:serine hydrolase n=1 Tax=Duganella sp. 1411 TaxID=2806572 RepID=UPI001AEAA111|nr:CubicO group peptidase (beta-lactamase class C family) [Duganella sp. 1411]